MKRCALTFLLVLLALTTAFAEVTNVKASAQAVGALRAWLAGPQEQGNLMPAGDFTTVPLTKGDAAAAQKALWEAHVAHIKATRSEEMAAKVIELHGKKMKFETVNFPGPGSAKEGGRSLFISMHGGGSAPPAVNESQWRNQIALAKGYKPSEGIYVAPRGPTDTWNLWHEAHIDGLFDRLIENMIVLDHVNPNRVYIMGYSAGGDGVYQLGPRMADRWAAAAMMAGHPNETVPAGLRNVPFALQVGANDGGFKRNEVAAAWGKQLDALHGADPKGYEHFTELHGGKGHWMDLQDRKAVPWMEKFTRNPIPDKIVWHQDDVTHDRLYWLAVPKAQAKEKQEITAVRAGQNITLTSNDVPEVTVLLSDAMLNLDAPITVAAGGKEIFAGTALRTIAVLARTLAERGDPALVFASEVAVKLP